MKYNGAPWITRGKSDDRQSKWSITNNILSEHITQLIQLEEEEEEEEEGVPERLCFKILIRYSVKSFKTTFSVTLAYCSWVISLSSSAARPVCFEKKKAL